MKLRVVNFETLTKKFLPYVNGWKKIENDKQRMSEEMAPNMKELQDIYSRLQSGLIVDQFSQQRDMERFKSLQEQMIQVENNFKEELKFSYEDLSKKTMSELSELVGIWAKEKDIDIIISKEEVLYNNPNIEVTDDILELFREKNLLDTEQILYKNINQD